MEIQKVLDRLKFSLFSPEMVRKMAAAKIIVPDTYDDDGYPIDGGLVDTRLGVVDPGLRCKTCGGTVRECPGHFGYIDLVRPVIHVEFAKHLYIALKSTCPNCHNLIGKTSGKIINAAGVDDEPDLPKEAEKKLIDEPPSLLDIADSKSISTDGISPTETAAEPKKKKSEKITKKKCGHCGIELPEIKLLKPTTIFKDKEMLLPTDIRDWIVSIRDPDLRELGFDPVYSRPEWMIVTALPVPPVNVRPSITLETGERSEDDLTHKLVDVIRINQKLEANINAGAPQLIIEDLWELLQYHVTTYFDNETANIPPARHRSGRPLKTLAQRLKGKEGRFRYNLSGKRVNFSARTVISPDPRIDLDEVGVPQRIAEELTIPMHVTEWNLEYSKKLVLSGVYPRAIYILRGDSRRIKVGDTDEMRIEQAENLKIGSILERQIVDGDISLFNRQPSLHRISMMAHEVRVLPGRTFRLNPVTVAPYNADFDGDEMNLHIMQTEEAQAEARYLAKVDKQLLSPRHGHAIIKPQEDHVSGLYFLTNDDAIFTKEEASNMFYLIGINQLPKSDVSGDKYSGKMLFSYLLPNDLSLKVMSKLGEQIVIKSGKLVKGAIESKAMEGELLEKIFISRGPDFTRNFLDSVTRLALEAISAHGLSVSLRDYTISGKGMVKIKEVTDKMDREMDNLIMQYKNRSLERSPGMTLQETLEGLIIEITTQARIDVGKLVETDLGALNPSVIMAKIGARGSMLNAIQMSALVAQQTVRSKRIARGYRRRILPYFKEGVLTGRERGFVYSSFHKGLTPYEFIHHAMGGREALVNTAIRTARSGYMQRRLINALQDLVVFGDMSVRNADMSVVQFIYGGDGKDPMYSSTAELAEGTKQDDIDTA
ncbi:DNA-directed RNA polymerase subunit A' [Candidatus Micrarchaeota archaeon]|nr:DNA-directed RNA polymerase subunit A' [Candidatus Micrarchaeota archaeon]MBU1165812.1 DNA-directed RNA polymerase subunit A' [Candidatus Micrarchaeota archaeon]MBU1887507.1 DNA-directed RNA polymerase subunit A' [Candidatus Micrarchaeota archaeon]